MFDIAPLELLVLGTVAIVVIPPKDLPKAMRVAGYWVGRVRGVARQFRSGFDTMVRESELHEMEKRWKEENERIMREHPPTPAILPAEPYSDDGPPMLTAQPAVAEVHEVAADQVGEPVHVAAEKPESGPEKAPS